ncbi:MAG: D-alanyl-D-alanine carboxypeptidase family protein [Sphingorhabdus sp.]
MRCWIAILLTLFAVPARADIPALESEAPIAYLIDISSGRILIDRNSTKRIPTASMAKMMTAYVAFEAMKTGEVKTGTTYSVKADTWQAWNNRGSTMFLKANEKVSVNDLLHGILTLSGNDASIVLAEGMSGSEAAFTGKMNKAAVRLGMADSHFATANGWPDEGRTYSTARDLSRLALGIINDYPRNFRQYFGQTAFRWNDVTQANRNPLLGAIKGADGMKTGHSDEAGYCLVGTAERSGRRLLMVIAGLPTQQARIDEARAIMQWGFDNWQAVPLFDKAKPVAAIATQLGTEPTVRAIALQNISALSPKGQSVKSKLTVRYKGPVKAPIRKGQRIAELIVGYPNGQLQSFPLVAANDVHAAGFFGRAWSGLRGLWS